MRRRGRARGRGCSQGLLELDEGAIEALGPLHRAQQLFGRGRLSGARLDVGKAGKRSSVCHSVGLGGVRGPLARNTMSQRESHISGMEENGGIRTKVRGWINLLSMVYFVSAVTHKGTAEEDKHIPGAPAGSLT